MLKVGDVVPFTVVEERDGSVVLMSTSLPSVRVHAPNGESEDRSLRIASLKTELERASRAGDVEAEKTAFDALVALGVTPKKAR